MVEVGFGEF